MPYVQYNIFKTMITQLNIEIYAWEIEYKQDIIPGTENCGSWLQDFKKFINYIIK